MRLDRWFVGGDIDEKLVKTARHRIATEGISAGGDQALTGLPRLTLDGRRSTVQMGLGWVSAAVSKRDFAAVGSGISMRSIRYIIWDFDGTLGERIGMWSGTLLEVLHANGQGRRLAAEDLRPFLKAGFRWHNAHSINAPRTPPDQWWNELEPVFQRAFCEGAGVPLAESIRLAKEVRQRYVDPTKWSLFSDASQTLDSLTADGWQHVLLTNHVPELRVILESLSIRRCFAAVFNSAETGIEKPHLQAFENVRSSLPENPKLWMIGDNFTADVQGAEAAGIPAILVRKPHPSAKRYAEDLRRVRSILGA